MKRNQFLQLSITPLLATDTREPAVRVQSKPIGNVADIKMHLDIWQFEVALNLRIPKKSFFEVNPHTKRYLVENIHLSMADAAARLEKDISLLLVVKENAFIVEQARNAGMRVYRNSLDKAEWPKWIDLLKELAKE